MFALFLASAVTAQAQDRLIIGVREIATQGRIGTVVGTVPREASYPRAGGGRFVIGLGEVIDARSGQRTPLFPDSTPRAVLPDPARPRVFGIQDDAVQMMTLPAGPVTTLASFASGGPVVAGCHYAYSADEVLCALDRGDGSFEIVGIGPSSGVTRSVLVVTEPDFSPAFFVTATGDALYYSMVTSPGPVPPAGIARLDLASGAVVRRPGYGTVVWDEANERVIVLQGKYARAYSRDLVLVRDALVGERCNALAVSPYTGRLYLYRIDDSAYGPVEALNVLDGTTYAPLAPTVQALTSGESCLPLRLLTPPGAPRDLQATVAGRDVTLSWTNVGAASTFALEVGVGPGRTDVMLAAAEPRITFANIPPGVYYLRVRGHNELGPGRLSQEIRVVVP